MNTIESRAYEWRSQPNLQAPQQIIDHLKVRPFCISQAAIKLILEGMAMKHLKRFMIIAFILTITAACTGFKSHSRDADIRHTIAEAYGSQNFENIEQIRYTFNVQIGERQIRRSWVWQPQIDRVTFESDNATKPTTYYRDKMSSTASADQLKKIDKWFINDNYWLLFPLRIARDNTVQVKDLGRKALPMGTGDAQCVVATFPAVGGYTPGDVYELYLDDTGLITHWVYRRSGATQPTRITTWEDHRKIGPLFIALNHRGSEPNFRVWFTDVALKTADRDTWIYPQ